MKPRYKKLLSMLLTAAMVFNIGLPPVFAVGTAPPGISGICTHHVEHTEDCGYQQGTPCGHTHTEDCYTKELTCKLIEGDAPEIATDSETAHTHDEDCYAQVKKCKHKHTVNNSEADRDGLLGGDEDCGYTPGSPCTFGPADCTQCNPGDKPTEKSCTCVPALGAGDAGHDEDCPLYTVPKLSEAVKALIRMVDALPGADTITEENGKSVKSDFDAARTAYEALSDEDKAVFGATEQHAKLMELHTAMYPGTPLADTYAIKVLALNGDSNMTYTISDANPAAGDLITVTVETKRPDYGTAGVDFYDNQTSKVITIPGYEIIRSYDNPNEFTFIMPPQNVNLQLRGEPKNVVTTNPYWEPDDGEATPASADGTITAVPYILTVQKLNGQIFYADDGITGFIYRFESGIDYGTVDCSGEYLKYTPNAAAANKTIQFSIKACSAGGVSTGKTFTVNVGSIPDASLNNDATLKTLCYSIDNAEPQQIILKNDVYEYDVKLPIDTATDKPIVLSGEATDDTASISVKKDGITSYVKNEASLTVQAQDTSVNKTYTVHFTITAPDLPRYVSIDNVKYVDGDTVVLDLNKQYSFEISIGSGAKGAGSCSYTSSNYEGIQIVGSFLGTYPGLYSVTPFTTSSACKSTITARYYAESTTNHNGLVPIETITLYIIAKTNIDSKLTASIDGWAYGDTAKSPALTGYTASGIPNIVYTYSGTESDGTNYAETTAPPTKAGNYSVKASYEDDAQIGSATAKFTITKSASELGLTTNKADNTFTYGDTITFTANVSIPASQARTTMPENTVNFYCGSTKLNESPLPLTESGGTGTASFTCETSDQSIPIGENIEITAKYGGSNNLNGTQQTINVTLNKRELTISNGEVTPKQYDGNANATVNGLTFDGLQNGETLALATDYTVGSPAYSDASVGTGKTVTGTATLISNSKTANYTLTGGYSIKGDITLADGPAAPTNGVVNNEKDINTFGFTFVDSITDATKYEYSVNSGKDWKDVTANPISVGNIGVPVGELQVRVKETATHKAGKILSSTEAFTPSIEGSLSASADRTYGDTITISVSGVQEGAFLWYKDEHGGTNADGVFFISREYLSADSVTFTVTAEGYEDELTLTVNGFEKRKLTVATTTVQNKEYDGSTAASVSFTLDTSEVLEGDTVIATATSTFADKNVGDGKTVSITDFTLSGYCWGSEAENLYTVTTPPTTAKANITAKPITPTIEMIPAVTYDGTAQKPGLTVKDSGDALTADDYTALYSNNINAGVNTGQVDVTLKGNYSGSANASFTINKASGLTAVTPSNIFMSNGYEMDYTFDLSTIAVNKNDTGTKTYSLGTLTDNNNIFKAAPSISGDKMIFTSNKIASPDINQATQVVIISTQNYEDTTVPLSFDIINKTPVTITGLTAATNLIYNGSAQNGYSGTAQFDNGWSGTLTYTYYKGSGIGGARLTGAPTNAGTYTVVASIPSGDPVYVGSHAPITFTIGTKEITVSQGGYKVSKAYDGTTDAGTGSGELNTTGILPTDNGVTVIPGTIPAYSDSAIKADYEIALPVKISGDTNSNYKLAAGTVTVPGEITKASVTATIDTIATVEYTGSQIKPTVTVKAANTLITDANYTVEYGTNVNSGPDAGSVTVKAKATGNYNFDDVTENFTISKAAGSTITGDITGSYTGNGTMFTYTITPISGAEYKMDSGTWQDSNVFTDILPQSKHTFSARMKEDANHHAGTEKPGDEVTFTKLSGVAAPTLSYTVSREGNNKTITITTVTDAEYQFGSEAWGSANAKTYSSGVAVAIGIRMKTTETHEPGTAATENVNLADQEQTAPAAFALTYTVNGGTDYTVTIPEVEGCEYSFDGTTYNNTRTKTANGGDTVTGYMRKIQTITHSASPAASASVTLPMVTAAPNGSSSPNRVNPTLPPAFAPPSTAAIDAKTSIDQNGNVSTKVDEQDIPKAIEEARKSEKQNGIAITLNVKAIENATSLEITLSEAAIAALSNAKVTHFTIHNGLTGITFDLTALGALAGGEVKLTISQVDVNSLSTEAVNAIGSRPVFRFGASVDGRAVTDFKGGRVSLQMPYICSTTEQSGNLCGVYVDDNGKVTWLENSSYDSTSGNMLTSATHFSIYGVGYKQNTPSFTDVDTHWAKNDIDFVVSRGLLTGADSTTFAPEQSMTRGMFVTALGRLANIDTSQYANTTFTDVAPAAYYAPYAAWADASGIVNGTTDTTFSPDNAITRQEMAVMLVNYNKAIGYKLPVVHTEVTFTDAGNIASWAKDAVRQMQMAGILMGKSGNRFDPTAAATRAEASTTLRRYVGLVVNPTPLTLLE